MKKAILAVSAIVVLTVGLFGIGQYVGAQTERHKICGALKVIESFSLSQEYGRDVLIEKLNILKDTIESCSKGKVEVVDVAPQKNEDERL